VLKMSWFEEAEKEFVELSQRESALKVTLKDKELLVEELEIRVEASQKTCEAAVQQTEAARNQAQVMEEALTEREEQHKAEMASARERVAELRTQLRQATDQTKATEADRDAALRKVSLLEKEVAASVEAEKEMSEELTTVETKLRAVSRELDIAKEKLEAKEKLVAESKSLAVEVDAKRTSLQELSARVIQTSEQLKTKERILSEERAKNDALYQQITPLEAENVTLKKKIATMEEEVRALTEQDAVAEELMERKNRNISALEKEMEEVEAEVSHLQAQLSTYKKQAKERESEMQSLQDQAQADATLAKQLQTKMKEADGEDASSRAEAAKKLLLLEQALAEGKKAVKEQELAADSAERERDALRTHVEEVEAKLREEQARAEAASQAAERVEELTKELEKCQQALHEEEARARQLREASGDLDNTSEQVRALEKEKRERKLVISTIFLGASDDGAALIAQCAKLICQSFSEWGTLDADGDGACLSKVANGYTLLLQNSKNSYHHCIRVLAQVAATCHELSSELAINDPTLHGVVSTKGRTPGKGNVGAFVDKMEAAVEKVFTSAVKAIFKRLNPYLAPAVLNHLPAIDENRIEETVVDSGSERGKFMMHTILSTLTHVRDLVALYQLPGPVEEQLFKTLACNINAYLFTYIIQTPTVCVPSNAFTIKTRLGLLDDWFGQQKNERLASSYLQFKPMDEAAMLLFVNRDTFTSWETIRALCPSLNELQVLSLVEMLSEDETQKVPLERSVRDEIDQFVLSADDQKLFFSPVELLPYEE